MGSSCGGNQDGGRGGFSANPSLAPTIEGREIVVNRGRPALRALRRRGNVLAMSESPPSFPPLIRTVAMPADTNPSGDIFGGWLLSQMDLAAGSAATRRARGRCATVALDAMTFLRPVFVGDEVSLYANVTKVGRTSMQVHVEAWRRNREDEYQERVTEALFTFVALDDTRRPRVVPPAADDGKATGDSVGGA